MVSDEVLGAAVNDKWQREWVRVILEGGEVPGLQLEYTEGRGDSKCREGKGRSTEQGREECVHDVELDWGGAVLLPAVGKDAQLDDSLHDYLSAIRPTA